MEKILSSFGRRKARKLRTQAQKAYNEKLDLVKIIPEQQIFEIIPQEIWLEIGFGGGEHLLEQLNKNPDVAIVGCEPFINGIASLLTHLPPKDVARTRVWPEDVRYFLDVVPSSYFSRTFILFPDPWPKKRQHKRRLITHEFIGQLTRTLKKGALLHIASDDVSYVEQIQEVLYPDSNFQLILGPPSADPLTWTSRPNEWPFTRYEQKALTAGKSCAYMIFRKSRN